MYFFQSSLFLAVLVHRFPACLFMLSAHIFANLSGLLDPLLGFHIVAACAKRLWSSSTKCSAKLYFIYGLNVRQSLFSSYNIAWCWNVICKIFLFVFLCFICRDFFVTGFYWGSEEKLKKSHSKYSSISHFHIYWLISDLISYSHNSSPCRPVLLTDFI